MSTYGLDSRGRASSSVRVVVVDDEPGVVDVFTQYLNLRGWKTIGFTNGRTALEFLERERQNLLVTDMMMPGFNGLQLVLAAKAAQPELKVLLVSGVNPKTWPQSDEAALDQVDAFLPKPMSLESLSDCCQRLLAQAV